MGDRERLMADYTNDLDILRGWVGRTEEHTETMSADRGSRLAHTLDAEGEVADGDAMAPLWHFIAHSSSVRLSELGRDGHPLRGGFLPPVALPRRMWAGGRFTFHGDIHFGEVVAKRSTIAGVEMKHGRTGALAFVTVDHELRVGEELRLSETQDLVFRGDPNPDAVPPEPKPAPDRYDFARTITPSEVMLFRYSALTFNGHRIHYDRNYARDVEGYPGLVFHGPLTATLLAELAVINGGRGLGTFSFRGMAPLFDDAPFTIAGTQTGDTLDLWAATPNGGLAMSATAELTGD